MLVRDNRDMYPRTAFERPVSKEAYELFPVEVMSVDYARMTLTVQDPRDFFVYTGVGTFPANYASAEGTDVSMPEPGAVGVAAPFCYENGGFKQIMIVAWVVSKTTSAVDAVAFRPVQGSEAIKGWTDRRRGTYRKAYPGQRTSVSTSGLSEREGGGWDRQSSDWSRDRLDTERRQWTRMTGRGVEYTDAGVSYRGSVSRPGATGGTISPSLLPDGTQQYVQYLAPNAVPADRYVSGKQDVMPFAEHTELVQEFSLDYAVPYEALQTPLMDGILGTTASPWGRTTVTQPSGQVAYDNETYMATQGWDHPSVSARPAVGPTTNEGRTPLRRGYILERAQGTLVGYNLFDKSTYGLVLKPVLFPYNYMGRFGADVQSGYLPVKDSADHEEARLAASCLAVRFPYEQNTTRLDVTKEGFTSLEMGSTLPKENIMSPPGATGPGWQGGYEHPHGAGRSLEAHLVGSAKLVIGKNRDEEDALDAQILGQSVLRLGADDTSLPNAVTRTVLTQTRALGDAPAPRTLQYWAKPNAPAGDCGSLTNKTGMENISVRAALDGGAVVRLGARSPLSKRRHLVNGYSGGQGLVAWAVGSSSRVDSKSPGRPTYGPGDSLYAFQHVGQNGPVDLTQASAPLNSYPPYNLFQFVSPVTSTSNPASPMDAHGQSLDLHAVRDILLRVGANTESGQSILIDTAGGVVLGLGTDKQGRSITGMLDGSVEITIRPNKNQRAVRLSILGDIDVTHVGNLQFQTTGDWTTECTKWRHVTKTDRIFTQQMSWEVALGYTTVEALDQRYQQGGWPPSPANIP